MVKKYDIYSHIGIGSSACLIVSLISSLMFSWNLIDEKVFYREEKDSKLSLIHLLSQIANIIAQNKIGSGFDISTAMYGSQIFQKFPESLITDEILKMFTMMNDFFTLKTKFFEIIEKFKIYEDKLVNIKTKNTQILMLDFTMGSDTRVLVGKVKEYLKENNQFVQDFYNDSNEMCKLLVNFLENDKGFTIENLELLRMKCGSYRQKLKLLGEYSQVEIEPDVITIIIDHLREKEKNILYSVCPGAGGYDAACFLMENDCKIDLEGYSEKIQELKEKKIKESLLEINKDLNNFNKEILEKIKGLHVSFIEKKIDKGKLNIMEF